MVNEELQSIAAYVEEEYTMRRPRSKSEIGTPMDDDNNYKIGAVVEVLSEQEEYRGGWFQATVVKNLGFRRYTVKYKNFVVPGVDGKKSLFTEQTSAQLMRPKPPAIRGQKSSFSVGEFVEVFHRLGWFKAVVLQIIPSKNSYSVRFATSGASGRTKEFHKSKIRTCREWNRGEWLPLQPEPRLKPQPDADTEISRPREMEESDWRDSDTCSSLPEPAVPCGPSGVPGHGFGEEENRARRDLVKERCVEAYTMVFGVFMRRGFPCSAERAELLRRLRNELNISVEEHERVVKLVLGEIGNTLRH